MIRVIGILLALIFAPCIYATEPDHNDKEHEKAEKDLDHKHWQKAHGSGVPDNPKREPPSKPEKSDD